MGRRDSAPRASKPKVKAPVARRGFRDLLAKVKRREQDLRSVRDKQADARNARHLLAEALVETIIAHPAEAVAERLPQMLWAECFYKDVSMFRQKIRVAKVKTQDAAAVTSLTADFVVFLKESANGRYIPWRERVEAAALLAPTAALAAHFRLVLHYFHFHLGDLSRYLELHSAPIIMPVPRSEGAGEPQDQLQQQQPPDYQHNWDHVKEHYIKAWRAYPDSGAPHNQLATLAADKGDNLLALHYFILAFMAVEPFPISESNIPKVLFIIPSIPDIIEDEDEEVGVDGELSNKAAKQLLTRALDQYVRLHGVLHVTKRSLLLESQTTPTTNKTPASEFNEQLASLMHDFDRLFQANALSSKVIQLALVVVAIFTVEQARREMNVTGDQGQLDDDVNTGDVATSSTPAAATQLKILNHSTSTKSTSSASSRKRRSGPGTPRDGPTGAQNMPAIARREAALMAHKLACNTLLALATVLAKHVRVPSGPNPKAIAPLAIGALGVTLEYIQQGAKGGAQSMSDDDEGEDVDVGMFVGASGADPSIVYDFWTAVCECYGRVLAAAQSEEMSQQSAAKFGISGKPPPLWEWLELVGFTPLRLLYKKRIPAGVGNNSTAGLRALEEGTRTFEVRALVVRRFVQWAATTVMPVEGGEARPPIRIHIGNDRQDIALLAHLDPPAELERDDEEEEEEDRSGLEWMDAWNGTSGGGGGGGSGSGGGTRRRRRERGGRKNRARRGNGSIRGGGGGGAGGGGGSGVVAGDLLEQHRRHAESKGRTVAPAVEPVDGSRKSRKQRQKEKRQRQRSNETSDMLMSSSNRDGGRRSETSLTSRQNKAVVDDDDNDDNDDHDHDDDEEGEDDEKEDEAPGMDMVVPDDQFIAFHAAQASQVTPATTQDSSVRCTQEDNAARVVGEFSPSQRNDAFVMPALTRDQRSVPSPSMVPTPTSAGIVPATPAAPAVTNAYEDHNDDGDDDDEEVIVFRQPSSMLARVPMPASASVVTSANDVDMVVSSMINHVTDDDTWQSQLHVTARKAVAVGGEVADVSADMAPLWPGIAQRAMTDMSDIATSFDSHSQPGAAAIGGTRSQSLWGGSTLFSSPSLAMPPKPESGIQIWPPALPTLQTHNQDQGRSYAQHPQQQQYQHSMPQQPMPQYAQHQQQQYQTQNQMPFGMMQGGGGGGGVGAPGHTGFWPGDSQHMKPETHLHGDHDDDGVDDQMPSRVTPPPGFG